MGLRTIAVYSEADKGARHLELCDTAMLIGAAPPAESYLRGDAIIEAALACGADAIHPGYGFLSENAAFAAECADRGIVFVGPPPAAIAAMGSKAAAKALMETAGIPLVPGYHAADQADHVLRAAAEALGWPVLLKASAGGGGRGMRVAENPEQFEDSLAAARREAVASFGDDRMLIEKYLSEPRHVEVQIFADNHGDVIHLFERDCSVQRRHQKILEEAPAPGLDWRLRVELGATAVACARAINYVGAGTVEFILDGNRFYFMEMNTRLQVEHPVTELVTGIDLVEWQLRIASGEALPHRQEAIELFGHAFEARLYAEDPVDFRPQTGRIHHLRFPENGTRVDTGVREGDTVSVHYDPLIAKIVVHGRDRAGALERLVAALRQTRVAGLVTNQPFLLRLAAHPAFAAALVHTGFIQEHAETLVADFEPVSHRILAFAALVFLNQSSRVVETGRSRSGDPTSPWHDTDGWRLNEPPLLVLTLAIADEFREITLQPGSHGYRMGGADITISGVIDPDGRLAAMIDGRAEFVDFALEGDLVTLFLPSGPMVIERVDRLAAAEGQQDVAGRLTAPMPGRITAVHVAAGDLVRRGTPLIVLEAMKMEHTITAPADGVVTAVHYRQDDLVDEGRDLLAFDPAVDG